MDEQTARRDLIRICQLMYERSYVVSSDGNVSVLLEDGRVLATPTMTCKGRMTDDLLAITDLEGSALNGNRASSELAMHLLIYRERPDVRAVCHAHPAWNRLRGGWITNRSTHSFGSYSDAWMCPAGRIWHTFD